MKMAFKGGLIPDDDDQENQGPEDEDHHHALGHSVDIPDECTVKGKWSDVRNLPESFDYRDQEVVSPVKNQGFCGSCWLFAALAGIESAFMLKYKEVSSSSSSSSSGPAGPSAFARMAEEDPTRLEAVKLLSNKSLPLSFSEMYTMDCLRKDHYRDPCEGGQPAKVFGASLKRGTVLTESADPYVPSNVSNRLPQVSTAYQFINRYQKLIKPLSSQTQTAAPTTPPPSSPEPTATAERTSQSETMTASNSF